MDKEIRRNNNIVYCFCGVIIVILIILITYLCHSATIFKESQEKIVNEHVNHVMKIDSIFYDIKTVILSNDTGTIVNSQELLSQLQCDSALFRREVYLSQEEMNNLVALHIEKIENDYAQIGIWSGVLSVIFIIFGFFAIFKIEESKTEAKNVLSSVKEQGDNAINDVKEQKKKALEEVEKLKNSALELGKSLSKIKGDSDSHIAEKTDSLKSLTESTIQATEKLDRITKLLEEVENKNAQYKWSIETMEHQMKQLEELTNSLQNIVDSKGKEASNE